MSSSKSFFFVPALLGCVGLLVVSACTTNGRNTILLPTPTATPVSAVSPAITVQTDTLTITIGDSSNAAYNGTHTLQCHPTGGTHPQAQAACAKLDQIGGDPFALGTAGGCTGAATGCAVVPPPGPSGMACTQVYGGPQIAHVTGTWKGKQVNDYFNRTDGCQISRWDARVPVLEPVPSAGSSCVPVSGGMAPTIICGYPGGPLPILGGSPVPVTPAPLSSSKPVTLSITIANASNAAYNGTHTLQCHPTGGTHPQAQAACAKLDTLVGGNPFAQGNTGAACAQVISGNQTAQISGTWNGMAVNASFNRTDACQTARWNVLVPVLEAESAPPGSQPPVIPAACNTEAQPDDPPAPGVLTFDNDMDDAGCAAALGRTLP